MEEITWEKEERTILYIVYNSTWNNNAPHDRDEEIAGVWGTRPTNLNIHQARRVCVSFASVLMTRHVPPRRARQSRWKGASQRRETFSPEYYPISIGTWRPSLTSIVYQRGEKIVHPTSFFLPIYSLSGMFFIYPRDSRYYDRKGKKEGKIHSSESRLYTRELTHAATTGTSWSYQIVYI